jgi:hypothetical protein
MKSAACLAVKTHITFMAMRCLMQVAALEYATDPSQKLLAKHYDAPGARKIGFILFNPASFYSTRLHFQQIPLQRHCKSADV